MHRIGIMQGRLVPPVEGRIQCFPCANWRDEFPKAKAAGLDSIEWIYDTYGEAANPLNTDDGIAELRKLQRENDVALRSICADWFMDFGFIRVSLDARARHLDRLFWLYERASLLGGISRIVLPFVDQSSIRTAGEKDDVAAVINDLISVARAGNIEIHLETDLGPRDFAEFLDRFPSNMVKVNYDSGNSASLGYRPAEEFSAYGKRVGSVHIKDRIRGGATVPLATGDCDFHGLFTSLRDMHGGKGYSGDFILQVARGKAGDEVDWSRANREFVTKKIKEYLRG